MIKTDPTPGRWYVFAMQHPLGVIHSLPLHLDSVINMKQGGHQYTVSSGREEDKVVTYLYSCPDADARVIKVIPVH